MKRRFISWNFQNASLKKLSFGAQILRSGFRKKTSNEYVIYLKKMWFEIAPFCTSVLFSPLSTLSTKILAFDKGDKGKDIERYLWNDNGDKGMWNFSQKRCRQKILRFSIENQRKNNKRVNILLIRVKNDVPLSI